MFKFDSKVTRSDIPYMVKILNLNKCRSLDLNEWGGRTPPPLSILFRGKMLMHKEFIICLGGKPIYNVQRKVLQLFN